MAATMLEKWTDCIERLANKEGFASGSLEELTAAVFRTERAKSASLLEARDANIVDYDEDTLDQLRSRWYDEGGELL